MSATLAHVSTAPLCRFPPAGTFTDLPFAPSRTMTAQGSKLTRKRALQCSAPTRPCSGWTLITIIKESHNYSACSDFANGRGELTHSPAAPRGGCGTASGGPHHPSPALAQSRGRMRGHSSTRVLFRGASRDLHHLKLSYSRLMQRFVPGAVVHPGQHCLPQTFGLSRETKQRG